MGNRKGNELKEVFSKVGEKGPLDAFEGVISNLLWRRINTR